MARKKEVILENGRYSGKYLSVEDCQRLEKIIQLSKEENSIIDDLKHIIYDLVPSEIEFIDSCRDGEVLKEKREGTLTGLQTIGVAFMYFSKRCLLGDSVGLGKTVQVCGLLNMLERDKAKEGYEFRFLYLTEKNLVEKTKRKLIQFTGNYVRDVYGDKAKVKEFVGENENELLYSVVGSHSLLNSVDFQEFFTMYETLYGYNPFDIIIIDESGVLGNSSTQISKNAKFLINKFERVVLMNATAFQDKLSSYYNQLSLVDDSFLPTKTAFDKEYVIYDYTGPYPKPSGKYKNAERFQDLVGYRYFARTRKSSGAVMKDCTAEMFISELSPMQKKLLTLTSMPRMVFDCPSYFGKQYETNRETTPKLNDLLGLVQGKLSNVDSILIYSFYKESQSVIQNALRAYGIESTIMNGSTDIAEKNAIINKFEMKDIRILITNVQKGLDFGNCNHCIFYSYDSSPSNMVQFEGRMTRSYDIIDKHVYFLISKGRELNSFKNAISDKAKAGDIFAGSDFSCVLSLLLNNIGEGSNG